MPSFAIKHINRGQVIVELDGCEYNINGEAYANGTWEIFPMMVYQLNVKGEWEILDDGDLRGEILGALRRNWSSQERDGLGFIIVHPGDLGTSVLVHWRIQVSVLCQQVRRWLPDSSEPLDMSKRNVLGCVWELGLINAEQLIWRDTMMGDAANPRNYLATRPDMTKV